MDCPRCSSLVLATDQWCHNCDLQRREAGTDDQAEQEAGLGAQTRAAEDTRNELAGLQPVAPPHLRAERLVLKSALKKSSSARRGHITFAATANVAAVESFKGLELWWRHEQLTRVRKRKAPSKNGETAGGTTGTAASSSVDGSADDGADRDLEQRTVNTDNVDGTADNARAAPPEVRPSQGLQELGNGDDHDQTGALNLNGCEGLSQKATTGCTTPEPPRWHGGTLAPPPHLADLYGPTPAEQQHTRRRTRDELTPELAEKTRRNREAAFEKRKRRR